MAAPPTSPKSGRQPAPLTHQTLDVWSKPDASPRARLAVSTAAAPSRASTVAQPVALSVRADQEPKASPRISRMDWKTPRERPLPLKYPGLGTGLPAAPPSGPTHAKLGTQTILNPRLAAGGSPTPHPVAPATRLPEGAPPAAGRATLPVPVRQKIQQASRRPGRWVDGP